MPTEVWRSVVGYEGRYEVSSLGRVRNARTGYELSMPRAGRAQYPQVTLFDGRTRTRRVHVLVAEAFIGPRPEGAEVAHHNGNTADNALGNLRYATKVDNEADKERHGTVPRGTRHGSARLSDTHVLEIRRRAAEGERVVLLAQEFGISRRHAYQVVNGERWAHLGD